MEMWIWNDPGHIHNGIHVVWFSEAIFEEDQTKCEETAVASMEEMVHADIIRLEVMPPYFIQPLIPPKSNLFGHSAVTYIPVRPPSFTAT